MGDIKAKVVEALRSGRYRQIQGRFADGQGGYCALGVIEAIGCDRRQLPQRKEIMLLNDSGVSFERLADVIEADEVELERERMGLAERERWAEVEKAELECERMAVEKREWREWWEKVLADLIKGRDWVRANGTARQAPAASGVNRGPDQAPQTAPRRPGQDS